MEPGCRVRAVAEFSPNRRYAHVFAIVRVDSGAASGAHPEEAITVTRVVWGRETAEAEVERLNELNCGKGSVYFWQITRLEPKLDQDGAADQHFSDGDRPSQNLR